jgi:hypothetical protein
VSRFLALGLSILAATSRPGEDPCPVCGSPRSAGACVCCGTYLCRECKKLHLGDATDPCPGNGVEPPKEDP